MLTGNHTKRINISVGIKQNLVEEKPNVPIWRRDVGMHSEREKDSSARTHLQALPSSSW
jgi:hypothetical protein